MHPPKLLDKKKEKQFFDLFRDYIDLEQYSKRAYGKTGYGLERMSPLANAAGNPERKLKIIHIAGTKGKGSTAFLTGALLQASSVRSGVFTSPHLRTVRERFMIDGSPVAYRTLLTEARNLENLVRKADLHPTLFEIMTVLALRIFANADCEYAVMEAGIGGDSIEEIAAQKAGIIKPGVPLVLGDQPYPEAVSVIRAATARHAVTVYEAETDGTEEMWIGSGAPRFLTANFATARTACKTLNLAPSQHLFRAPAMPARFEKICDDPLVLLDAAHNAESAAALAQSLSDCYPGERFQFVIGTTGGKAADDILKALRPAISGHVILTHPDVPPGRASGLDELTAAAERFGMAYTVIPEIETRDQLPSAAAFVFTGSFFTALAGDRLFGENRKEP